MNAIAQSLSRTSRSLRLTAGALGLAVIALAATPPASAAPWNDGGWSNAPAPVRAPQDNVYYPQAAPVRVPVQAPRFVCSTCGTVEAVNEVQHRTSASGAGAVAGGLLGAVLGSQLGKGSGNSAATFIGAIGGGLLGHALEKNADKVTAYQMNVRMEDGSLRSVEQAAPVSVGTRVVFEGDAMRADAPAPRTVGYPGERRRFYPGV